MKTNKESVTFRLDHRLRQILEAIAREEKRSFSSQINLAIEQWLEIRNELHPGFVNEIKKSLKSGPPEPVWKG